MVQLMTEARSSLAGELDGKFPDALRNILFGSFGEDLFTRNAFRSAEVGMQTYNKLAKCFGVKPVKQVRRRSLLLYACCCWQRVHATVYAKLAATRSGNSVPLQGCVLMSCDAHWHMFAHVRDSRCSTTRVCHSAEGHVSFLRDNRNSLCIHVGSCACI
jgi:hypothetical protein